MTYKEAFDVQPFGNYVNAVTLTGEQLRLVLEQQFITPARSTQLFMGTSEGFRYDYDVNRAPYDRVDPDSIEVVDRPPGLRPGQPHRHLPRGRELVPGQVVTPSPPSRRAPSR